MREIMRYNNTPCVKQINETSCASADFTMVANGLNLNKSIEDILRVTQSEIGFALFWKWLVEEKNVEITDFSQNKLKTWAESGFDAFAKVTDEKVVKFLNDRMQNPADYQKDLQFLFNNPKFHFVNQKPDTKLLKEYFSRGYVCDVMLDPWLIYGEEPEFYSLHRVFIVDIKGDEITFHDPSLDGGEFVKSNANNFDKAFQIEGSELTCYKTIVD